MVFGMEKFETNLYVRKVLVQSDLKPLEAIFKKSLLNAYKKGTSLVMGDALSRVYLPLKEATGVQEDIITVLETRSPSEIEVEQVNMLQYL